MREFFPNRLSVKRLFCRRCRKVTSHGLFAKEPYSTYGGMDPYIPLLCSCNNCQTTFVSFSQEFYFGTAQGKGEYAKIHGKNRIAPGNWIYFKGSVKPGIVKSHFQTNEKEVFLVNYDGVNEQKIECPKCQVITEDSPEGYRLLPGQSAHTLIGDHVYHTVRNQFGVSVGLVKDGEKDKLAVLLEDESLLFITLPQSMQNLSNDRLSDYVCSKLHQLFPEDSRKISITVGQGIIYLDGLVKNLSVKRAICACINSMPRVRGCVDFMKIRTDSYISDNQIERSIYSLLETPGLRVFDYKVQVSNGNVDVAYSCIKEYCPKEIENKISEFLGVQNLHVSVTTIPEEDLENSKMCREMEYELSVNNLLSGSIIRVSFTNNRYLLEGKVQSILQKQIATFCIVKKIFPASTENRLRIV